MIVNVLLFGREREVVGRESVEVDVPRGTTAAVVVETLVREWPGVKGARLAVNHAFARGDETIGEGDELALIGMVSGG